MPSISSSSFSSSSSSSSSSSISHLHPVVLQSIVSRRTVEEQTWLVLYKRACMACAAIDPTFRPPYPTTTTGLAQLVSALNDQLLPLGFQIKRGREQTEEGMVWWTFANIDGNFEKPELGQQVSDLDPLTINYYRDLIHAIIESYPNNSLRNLQALSVAKKVSPNLTPAKAQDTLNLLVSRHYLSQSKRSRYSLSPRALVELDPWLRSEYADSDSDSQQPSSTQARAGGVLKVCAWMSCGALVMQGWRCANDRCDAHVHLYCRASLIQAKIDKCPTCDTPWSGPSSSVVEPDPVGEAASDERGLGSSRMATTAVDSLDAGNKTGIRRRSNGASVRGESESELDLITSSFDQDPSEDDEGDEDGDGDKDGHGRGAEQQREGKRATEGEADEEEEQVTVRRRRNSVLDRGAEPASKRSQRSPRPKRSIRK